MWLVSSQGRWPNAWTGVWIARDAKTVTIGLRADEPIVTVAPGPEAPPYESSQLLGGGTKLIDKLPAACWVDGDGRLYLEVEAGTDQLGPTYRLYAAQAHSESFKRAEPNLAPGDLVLIPNTSIGLYDDYDDDLGVPWAYPLEPMRRAVD